MVSGTAVSKATFAAGCFWHVEEAFRRLPGVLSTTVGYTGGQTPNPTYEQVCTGRTGHAESVQVTYDPSVISYEQLLQSFWDSHDPTQKNRQGPDVGTQYRSAIFTHTPEQAERVRASLAHLASSRRYQGSLVTEIAPASLFYPAEAYHQQYLEKHGLAACPR